MKFRLKSMGKGLFSMIFQLNSMEKGIFLMIFQLKSMERLESKHYTPPPPQAAERSEVAYIIAYNALNKIQVNL